MNSKPDPHPDPNIRPNPIPTPNCKSSPPTSPGKERSKCKGPEVGNMLGRFQKQTWLVDRAKRLVVVET